MNMEEGDQLRTKATNNYMILNNDLKVNSNYKTLRAGNQYWSKITIIGYIQLIIR